MLNVERLDYIIKELQKEKAVYVEKLAKKFFTSEATIRRDLSRLEKEGYLHRTHGGAVIADPSSHELPYAIRGNHSAKDVIGALAANMVKDDMFLFMDASSTAMHMVKYLAARSNLRIVTTSAQTALQCLDTLNAHIYCTGGWIHSYSRGFIGEDARERIASFNTDIAFFSARAH